MNLESQVCSLDLAKRLKELGVKDKSIFGWVYHNYGDKKEWIIIRGTNDNKPFLWGHEESGCKLQSQKDKEISAYLASELLEMLPDYIDRSGNLKIKKHDVRGEGITYYVEYGYGYYEEQDTNLSNALAKMLIHLIENKLIGV